MVSTGLSHVTFIVRYLDRMEQLLTAVLGGRLAAHRRRRLRMRMSQR